MRALQGQVAQSVEQRTENPCVGGSIPPLATKFQGRLYSVGLFICIFAERTIRVSPTHSNDQISFASFFLSEIVDETL